MNFLGPWGYYPISGESKGHEHVKLYGSEGYIVLHRVDTKHLACISSASDPGIMVLLVLSHSTAMQNFQYHWMKVEGRRVRVEGMKKSMEVFWG